MRTKKEIVTEAGLRWDRVHGQRPPEQLSWFEPVPEISLQLIEEARLPPDAAVIDVGGGTSALASCLVDAGRTDVTVVDVSAAALALARRRSGAAGRQITWIVADVRAHDFGRCHDLWHDRALFHFMVDPADRERYLAVMRNSLRPAGHLILAAFGPDGPIRCSGLPVERYGPEQLAITVGAGFEMVSWRLAEHHTPNGGAQQFLYAHLRRRPPGTDSLMLR